MVVILALTIAKDMNFEYIPQRKKQKAEKQKANNPPLARAVTDFVSNAPVISEEAEQVVFDGGSILH